MSRQVNLDYDIESSMGHIYNANLVERYVKKNSSILDIGCWSGQLYGAFQNKPLHYFGLDCEPNAVRTAKKCHSKANWAVGALPNIPFPKGKFDLVVLFDVLEHVPTGEEEACLSEIKRVLKKDGILMMSTPSDKLLSKVTDPAYFLSGHRHYGKRTLKKLLEESGFKILDIWSLGGMIYISYYLTQMFFKHIFKSALPQKLPLFKMYKKLAQDDMKKDKGILEYYLIAKSK